MARRKINKRSVKRTAKRQTTKNKSSNIQKLEKDFLATPAKLATQAAKEVKQHKKNELKFKNALNKAETKVEKAEKRLDKAKDKKKAKIAQKDHQKVIKLHKDIHQQYQVTSDALAHSQDTYAKYTSLNKQISQFIKDWAKDSKKTTVSAKSKSKNQAQPKDINNKKSNHETSRYNDFDNSEIEIMSDEATELTS